MRHRPASADAVPMLDYVDRRFDDLAARVRLLDDEVDRRFSALQGTITLSREAMEHRLAGMNEFRDSLRDQDAKNVTRDVLDGIVGGLREQDRQQEDRLRTLEARMTSDEGGATAAARLKESRRSNLTVVAGVATALLFLVSVALSVVIATHAG